MKKILCMAVALVAVAGVAGAKISENFADVWAHVPKAGTDWTVVAEGKNLAFGKAGEIQHLMLKRPGAWPAIRVEITANNGATTTTVGEIELLAP